MTAWGGRLLSRPLRRAELRRLHRCRRRPLTSSGGAFDLCEFDDAVDVLGAVKDRVVVIQQRQAEDRLVRGVERTADLKDRPASLGEIGLPVGLRRASELDILTVLALQRE
jgi:hypothetical protein